MIEALDIAYDVKDDRPFWKTRLLAIALAAIIGALLLTAPPSSLRQDFKPVKLGAIRALHGNAPELIGGHAYRPALVELVFPLHHFASGLRNISRECKEQILGDTLLDSYAGRGVLVVAADHWINLQTGDSCELLHVAAHFTCSLRGNHGVGALAGGSRLLRRLAAGNQVNDVRRCQGRVGNIGRSELVERPSHGECEIVLLDGSSH